MKTGLVTMPSTFDGHLRNRFDDEVTTSCPYLRTEVVYRSSEEDALPLFD